MYTFKIPTKHGLEVVLLVDYPYANTLVIPLALSVKTRNKIKIMNKILHILGLQRKLQLLRSYCFY